MCGGLRTPRLSYLDVSENSLGEEGIAALASAIPRLASTHLHHLDLSGALQSLSLADFWTLLLDLLGLQRIFVRFMGALPVLTSIRYNASMVSIAIEC